MIAILVVCVGIGSLAMGFLLGKILQIIRKDRSAYIDPVKYYHQHNHF